MPSCNRVDRAALGRRYPTRKGAHFRLVLVAGSFLDCLHHRGC